MPGENELTTDEALFDQFSDGDAQGQAPGSQPRDEGGRFAVKEEPATPEQGFQPVDADPKPALKDPSQPEAPRDPNAEPKQDQQPQGEQDAAAPPNSWSAKAKAKWDAIDPDVKAEIRRREAAVDRGFAQYAGLAKHVDAATRAGTSLPEALDRYSAAEDLLMQDFTLGVAHLAQMAGVPLGQLVQDIQAREAQLAGQVPPPRQQPQPSQPRQPDIRSAVAEELESRKATETINSFFADPKNRYAENVRPLMATFLTQGRASSLQEAYDMACRADPEVWGIIQAELKAPPAPPANQAAVKQAKRASGSLTGSPPLANGRSAKPGQTHLAADAELYDEFNLG